MGMIAVKGIRVTTQPAPDAAEVLYPPEKALEQPFRREAEQAHDVVGLDTPGREKRQAEFTTMIKDTGLDPYVVAPVLYGLQTEADVLDARGEQLSLQEGGEPQADDEARVMQAWNEEARRTLRETYGQHEAEDLLARADRFVTAHPKLATLMGRHGIGSRPEVVEAIVEHVRRVNFR